MVERLLGISDVATLMGCSIQNVSNMHREKSKRLPKPDFMVGNRPAWRFKRVAHLEQITPDPPAICSCGHRPLDHARKGTGQCTVCGQRHCPAYGS